MKYNSSTRYLISLAEYPATKILDEYDLEGKVEFIVEDVKYCVDMSSQRYKVFDNDLRCACCGLIGTVFILQRQHNHPLGIAHFNLYGELYGQYVLMTKDHINPLVKGGSNRLDNYQTMCEDCNRLKGGETISIEGLRRVRAIYDELRHTATKKKLAKAINQIRKEVLETEIMSTT